MSTLYAKFKHILPWICRGSCISVRFLRLLSNLVVRVVISAEKKTRLIKLTFCVLIVSKKKWNFSAGDNLLSVSQESKSVY